MNISLIVAMDQCFFIKDMPWGDKSDFDGKRFFDLTRSKPIIIGRKAYEPIGKPFRNRTNIVLTRDREFKAPGCFVVRSVKEALSRATLHYAQDGLAGKMPEVMVVGGEEMYKLFLPIADKIYRTTVCEMFAEEGDKEDDYFPIRTLVEWEEWRSVESEKRTQSPTEICPWKIIFETLERKDKSPVPRWQRGF